MSLLELEPIEFIPDSDGEYEFHIEDEDRPNFALCGEELEEDDAPRPLVKGIYDCPECWRIHEQLDQEGLYE